jgi:hypothetical protein
MLIGIAEHITLWVNLAMLSPTRYRTKEAVGNMPCTEFLSEQSVQPCIRGLNVQSHVSKHLLLVIELQMTDEFSNLLFHIA